MVEKFIFIILVTIINILFTVYLNKLNQKINLIKTHKNISRWRTSQKPIFGGFIFVSGFFLSLIFIIPFFSSNVLNQTFYNFSISLFLIFILGLADDFLNINAYIKIFIQTIIVIFLLSNSLTLNLFDNNLINILFTTIFILWFINAFNMLDNIDGLLGMISLLLSFTFLILNIKNFLEFHIIIAFIISGIIFLSKNLYPAKIYLGDNGSYFIGLFLSYFFLKTFSDLNINIPFIEKKILFIYLFLIIPITDSFTVIINRILRKQLPFIGGKDHTSHLLINKGIQEKYVPMIFSLMNLIGIIGALSVAKIITLNKISEILIIICCIFVTLYLFINDYIYYNKKKRASE